MRRLFAILCVTLVIFVVSYAATSVRLYGDIRVQGTKLQRVLDDAVVAVQPYVTAPFERLRERVAGVFGMRPRPAPVASPTPLADAAIDAEPAPAPLPSAARRRSAPLRRRSPAPQVARSDEGTDSADAPPAAMQAPPESGPPTLLPAQEMSGRRFERAQNRRIAFSAYGDPLMTGKRFLEVQNARAYLTQVSNVSAATGGVVTIGDQGDYVEFAPGALARDAGVTVSLSAPALPASTAYEPRSEALMIRFSRPVMGVAYAPAVDDASPKATVKLLLSSAEQRRMGSEGGLVIKRVVTPDGGVADFAEDPGTITGGVFADIWADHILRFCAQYGGTIIVSVQHPTTVAAP